MAWIDIDFFYGINYSELLFLYITLKLMAARYEKSMPAINNFVF